MPAGQTPHTTVVYAHNDLVDKVQPGDRINITGKNGSSEWIGHRRVSQTMVVIKKKRFLEASCIWDLQRISLQSPEPLLR